VSEELVDKLAEEFLARLRRGEAPSVAEYVERHPDLADDIRELFPPLLLMEEAARPASADRDAPPRAAPSQLGEYRILREVGRGGMGVVYEAEQVTLGRHVALKVLPRRFGDERLLDRFRQEARAAARLHHTNIVPVFGVGEHQGTHYYAMQFIRGRGLDEVVAELRRLRASGAPMAHGPLEISDPRAYYRNVARIGLQVAEALAYAHKQGVLHRDIKPSNLLLDAAGTVWVTDFGLAKEEGADQLTQTGDIVGTIVYMAPERFHGWADPRSDVYSLGLTLYEMLVLAPAFTDTNYQRLLKKVLDEVPPPLRRFDAAIPKDLETIVMKAIAKEPAQRYRSANQLAKDLDRFLQGEPIRARRSSIRERVALWARRAPSAAALVAVTFAAVAILVASAFWYGKQLSDALDDARKAEAGAVAAKAEMELALRRTRALALVYASEIAEDEDPMLALLLAREAARTVEMPEVVARLARAIRDSGPQEAAPQPVTARASADLLVLADASVTRELTPEERRRFAALLEPWP
jgi:eukaryotic-like serine/threonine-protein kinase